MTSKKPPKVFISYAWEEDLKGWVIEFAKRLRADGVNAILDQWEAKPGDPLPEFMEKSLRESDFVVFICTPTYKRKSDRRKGGVGYEGNIITSEVFLKHNHRKYIPLLQKGKWKTAAPSWAASKFYIDFTGEPYNEESYKALLNALFGRSSSAPPVWNEQNIELNKQEQTVNLLSGKTNLEAIEDTKQEKKEDSAVVELPPEETSQIEVSKQEETVNSSPVETHREAIEDANQEKIEDSAIVELPPEETSQIEVSKQEETVNPPPVETHREAIEDANQEKKEDPAIVEVLPEETSQIEVDLPDATSAIPEKTENEDPTQLETQVSSRRKRTKPFLLGTTLFVLVAMMLWAGSWISPLIENLNKKSSFFNYNTSISTSLDLATDKPANTKLPNLSSIITENIPSPTATVPFTLTPSPTIYMSPTATPKNFVLAENGYDIADVRLSFPREDMMIIDFKYRLDESRKSRDTYIYMTVPSQCMDDDNRNSPPQFLSKSLDGEARFEFKTTLQGVCSADGIEFTFYPDPNRGANPPFYREFVSQPYQLVRNFPTVNSGTFKVENMKFTATELWGGKITFDYAISDTIPIPSEQYKFVIYGSGPGQTCPFGLWEGPTLSQNKGEYTLTINLYRDLGSNYRNCLEGRDKVTFTDSYLSVVDILAGKTVYHQALNMPFSVLKKP